MIPPTVMRWLDRLRTFGFSLLGLRTMGAMALLVNDDNKILLVRQTYSSQMWTLPGGGVKRSESFAQAAVREASEEAGVRLREDGAVELFGIYFKRVGRWSDHIAVYVITGWDAEPTTSSEIAAIERFPLDALPSEIVPSTRRRIDEWRGIVPPRSTW